MKRFVGRSLGAALVLLGVGVLVFQAWVFWSGPYLEALPAYSYCEEAERALATGAVQEAIEVAEAGGCIEVAERARALWRSVPAIAGRCAIGIWTGVGDDAASVSCAIASDLVLFGDVRDLTRQAVHLVRGEDTDPVLVALSAAGVVLTVAPHVDAGTALMKVARRAGTITDRLAGSITSLVRRRAWQPLADLLGDAGRISAKLGPGDAAKALAYADSAEEVADVARFVEQATTPLLALRWGGKGVARIADDALYRTALERGPDGLRLAASRGARALLSRKPFVVFAAKTVVKHPDAVMGAALAIATWLLTRFGGTVGLVVAATLIVVGGLLRRVNRRRPRRGRVRLA
ncbi:MAG: hypothetical protein R6W77_17155 [Trueperaceae bacterium]